MTWAFPLLYWHLDNLPSSTEPGSFGFKRTTDFHTGIDLYIDQNKPNHDCVRVCEDGIVVAIENYTGPEAGSPWWNSTKSILIEGESGVICYGEIEPINNVKTGEWIRKGQQIGIVIPVLKKAPKTYIPNHSRCMLHFELYKHGTIQSVWWRLDEEKPENLLDPTEKLQEALNEFKKF